ncbi:CDP-alcohol phosphatidyltransferase family protein [Tritrichomonas foetus]|uniref:CDP-alcohol phosphatidyltransferase family protein n=1 Tax=Tritrichomonas foetus TaxID=1144522 RepID=A0A1J4JUY7_9EUKA|nr:CDP-alcohol phosphatidyltransferase family protein [Tritrichomonas foetus]|eukprot:OHT01342.1 CDP-alcohol phosphatidyltransferase family protein [Tritrichomonas foetus]
MRVFRNIFSPEEIENAKNYKYNGQDDSIFAKLFLRKYWDFLITFFPMTMAPNLITLIGFLFEVVSFLLSFIFSAGLQKPIPGWLCIFNGISLHVYQTLDNLDGRQARRTGSSSPLGQFFDHGCDAITGVLELLKVAMSFNMGNTTETFYFVFGMSVGFFLTSWEEYITHGFYLGPINGPDEGLVLLAIAQVASGLFPSIRPVARGTICKVLFSLGMIGTIGPIFVNVIKQSLGDPEKLKKAGISIIPSIISISLFMFSAFSETNPISSPYFTMGSGLVLQFQSQMTIVAYLTLRQPSKLFTSTLAGIWLFSLMPVLITSLNVGNLYWGIFSFGILAVMVHFDLGVIFGLSRGLGIPVLTLKEKEENNNLEIVPEDLHEEEETAPKEVPMNIFQDAKEEEV